MAGNAPSFIGGITAVYRRPAEIIERILEMSNENRTED